MKTLLKVGSAAVVLLASIGAFAVRAGNNTPTLYAVTNLGPGSAFKASNPDSSGTFLVVGSSPDPVNPNGPGLATVWTVSVDGTVVDVFTYDTLGHSFAIDVNDHGMIIGSAQFGPFVDVPGVGVKFLPEALQVEGLNNQGAVVGFTSDPSGPDGVSGAVWYVDATGGINGPVLTTIGPGVTFMPLDINDEGTMSGFILTAGSSNTTAAIAEFDRHGELDVTNLGVLHPGDTGAIAWSINSDGLVAGISGNSSGSSAFVWDPSQPNKLTSLGIGFTSPDINDNAQIVFSSVNKANATVGVIWQNGKRTDLNTLLTAPLNDVIELAAGINNTGHIVGLLQSRNACVLTPQ
jgi:hypothetical protein